MHAKHDNTHSTPLPRFLSHNFRKKEKPGDQTRRAYHSSVYILHFAFAPPSMPMHKYPANIKFERTRKGVNMVIRDLLL
jgi:hypothetical protein